MKNELRVLEDMNEKVLVFRSYADAKKFSLFLKIYEDESGAGNGYGAYWSHRFYVPGSRFLPFTNGIYLDSEPIPVFSADEKEVEKINADFIRDMACAILSVRFADEPCEALKKFAKRISNSVKQAADKGITFLLNVEDLPDAQRPAVGDMYRIPRSRMDLNDEKLAFFREGKVVEDLGEKLKVVSCFSFSSLRKGEKPEVGEIQAWRAIKIDDWLSQCNK